MATAFLNRFQRDKSDRQTKCCKMPTTEGANGDVVVANKSSFKATGMQQPQSSSSSSSSNTQSSTTISLATNSKDTSTTTTAGVDTATTGEATTAETATNQPQQPRARHRYMRSATAASVTQLLSESCNSLLQRFRRNPSERPDKQQQQQQQRKRDLKSPAAAAIKERSASKTPTNDNNYLKTASTSAAKAEVSQIKDTNNNNKNNNSKAANKNCNKNEEKDDNAKKSTVSMSDRHRRYNPSSGSSGYGSSGRYQKSSTTASALDRLRSNLSPVTSYYKPLMRSFGKRGGGGVGIDDDRKDIDKDKTPTATSGSSKLSTISRLESKYSDILDRVGRRRNHDEDRDKTLEPDENYNPLARSATTHQLLAAGGNKSKLSSSSFNANDRKERTPYRLTKNKTSRYLGDSNDSGYLTSSNGPRSRGELTMLDDNYPLDYSGASGRYRSGRHYDVSQSDYDARLMAGGYPSASNRYGRTGDYASSYKPRSGLDYSNYYDGSRMGARDYYKSRYDPGENYADHEDGAHDSARRPRQYGRNKTSANLATTTDGVSNSEAAPGRSRYEQHEDQRRTGTRAGNRRASGQASEVQRPRKPAPQELDSEEQELLADDRSSADNAAILLLLREDSQYIEAKKFEERMRKRKELKDRMVKHAQEEEAYEKAEQAKKQQEEIKLAKEKERQEMEAAKAWAKAAESASTNNNVTSAAATVTFATNDDDTKDDAKKQPKSKKVTSNRESVSSESSSGSSSDTSSSSNDIKTTPNKTTKPTTTTTTTKNDLSSNTTQKPNAAVSTSNDVAVAAPSNTTSTTHSKISRFLRPDRNNNDDISKYAKPTANSGGLMHSSSSGALAFGGISERLAAGRNRYQPKATSRTAAVLSEFDATPSAATSAATSSRYQYQNDINNSYRSYLLDSYNPYGGRRGGGGGSGRIDAAAVAGMTSSLSAAAYQRQQMQAYQQQQHQHQQQHQYMLSKSATSAALFNRSRIPKTLSTFVSLSSCSYSLAALVLIKESNEFCFDIVLNLMSFDRIKGVLFFELTMIIEP